jgi:RNA polymerase sigma factor (sigma-70 family)
MSYKFRRPEQEPLWLPLLRKYLAAIDAPGDDTSRWLEIWLMFLADAWLRGVIKSEAARVAGREKWQQQLAEDVEHAAMRLLARQLQHDYTLKMDRSRIERSFPAWIRKIVRTACVEALRHQRTPYLDERPLPDGQPAPDDRELLEQREWFRMRASKFKEPTKSVLLLSIAGDKTAVIAQKLGISVRTVNRHRQRGMQQLKDQART